MPIIDDVTLGQTELRALIDGAECIVALTGAGISTECGVPDFRSPDSPWLKNPPVKFQDWLASPELRVEAWRRKFVMDDLYAHAVPGRTHKALARLAQDGRLSAVITQNIDGLHQASGLPAERLIELHGNGTYARCIACGTRYELAPIRRAFEASGQPPECACGGLIKSASVWFGQKLPEEAIQRAVAAAKRCDLFLALGTSLQVYPAAALPPMAETHGATVVLVTREPTKVDMHMDLVVRADVGTVFEPWCHTE